MIFFTGSCIVPVIFYNLITHLHASPSVKIGNEFDNPKLYPISHSEIEIAVFCDHECARSFNYNNATLLRYWKELFFDVQSKYGFESFVYKKISFVVNSIHIFNSAEQEEVIAAGSPPGFNTIHSNFAHWLYGKRGLPNHVYDIAIIQTGNITHGDVACGSAFFNRICIEDSANKAVLSSMALHIINANPSLTVAHEIGHLLGAIHDKDETGSCRYANDPSNEPYIMQSGVSIRSFNGYYFSDCSRVRIVKTLSDQGHLCLAKRSFDGVPLINTAELPNHRSPLKINEQCSIMFHESSIPIYDQDSGACGSVNCTIPSWMEGLPLKAFEGSPCDEDHTEKRCHRGRCISPGFLLKNVKANDSLRIIWGNQNSDDDAILYNSTTNRVFMSQVINFEEIEPKLYLLWTRYDLSRHPDPRWCLSFNNQSKTKSVECSASSEQMWEIHWIKNSNEFLLKNKLTETYLSTFQYSRESHLVIGDTQVGPHTKWTFVYENETGELTQEIFEKLINDAKDIWSIYKYMYGSAFVLSVVLTGCILKSTGVIRKLKYKLL